MQREAYKEVDQVILSYPTAKDCARLARRVRSFVRADALPPELEGYICARREELRREGRLGKDVE